MNRQRSCLIAFADNWILIFGVVVAIWRRLVNAEGAIVSRTNANDIGRAKAPVFCNRYLSQAKRLKVLSISAIPEDYHALCTILNDPLWQITKAGTCKEAIARLSRKHIPVVVCECNLPDGSWRDILNHITELVDPPVLIVTSRLADEHLWAEVLNLGGFDVLATPFHESEVTYAVTAACRRKNITVLQQAYVGSLLDRNAARA
jgi:response regulator RpfG family c-di-GMP phosphodiesterase